MTTTLWIGVLVALALLVVLQIRGVRALEAWGVRPSRVVLALRALNIAAAVALIGYVFWKWVG